MSRVFSLATLVVGGLIIADFLAHYGTTSNLIKFGSSESNLLAGGKA